MTGNAQSPNTKKCPFCAEEIKAEAIKCKHCGELLVHKKSPSEGTNSATEKRAELNEMIRQGRLQRGDPEVDAAIRRTVDDQKLEEQREADTQITCPRCGSTQLSTQRKGFGWGKALVGGVLTGGIGLIAGFHGSRKVLITCLKCGNQFYPGSK